MRRIARRTLLGAVVVLLVLTGWSCLGEEDQSFEVELARAHNLFVGSPVKVLGVEVGRVEALDTPSGSEAVVATVRVSPQVEIPAQASARLVQGAVLGERFIQLDPPYTGGDRLQTGERIPVERTRIPAEFDELLASLDEFLAGLPPEEVDRFIVNVAETLVGQGEQLGTTLESTSQALSTLRANDDELVSLLVGVADLTETLGTRDAELRALLDDYASLSGTLASERDAIDLALAEAARVLVEVEDLLDEQGERLGASTEVLTRIGRTVDRNHTEIERVVAGQASLYRHAERIFDRERNWLPLIAHEESLPRLITERLAARMAGLCERAGLPGCDDLAMWLDALPSAVCIEPVLPCLDPDGEAVPFEQAIEELFASVPLLEELLLGTLDDDDQDAGGAPETETAQDPDTATDAEADAGDADATDEPPLTTPDGGLDDDDESDDEPSTSALDELLGGLLGAGR